MLPTIESLNKVRNQIAHTFELNRSALDEILQINSEEYKNFRPKHDRERIKVLRNLCAFICGKVAGGIEARYAVELYSE